jgi:hypothetical protein
MSTLKITTLSNLPGTLTIGVDRIAQGVAAAWVNFNGVGVVAIRASFNVSSITDNGVGDYTVNFTTAFADTNYSFVITTNGDRAIMGSAPTVATSTLRFQVDRTVDLARQDPSIANVSIFR